MNRRFRGWTGGAAALLSVAALVAGACGLRPQSGAPRAFETVARLVDEIRAASYPDLRNSHFRYQTLDSDFDFLQTRFTGWSFLFSPSLDYVIMVNPKLIDLNVPSEALRAIVAHELAHAEYFQTRRRFELPGLVRLLSPSFTARFERSAELMAIQRGYGPGLRQYRVWLYQNVPPNRVWEKQRDYFTPEEIDAIDSARSKMPAIMDRLNRCVPLTMPEM